MVIGNKYNISKEFLIKNYLQNKKSFITLSKETGIPYETLYWYKKKFHIPSHPNTLWHKGKHNSPATEFKKGQKPWNTGTRGIIKAWNKGIKLSEEYKHKVSEATKKAMARPEIQQKTVATRFKKGHSPWNKDKTNVYTKEMLKVMSINRLKMIYPKKDTACELALFQILAELNIPFKKHFTVKDICQPDAFVEPNITIFADGDYWHCNPKSFPVPKSPAQIKNMKRDKLANERLTKEGYIVLRFWEDDLLNNKEQCERILLFHI